MLLCFHVCFKQFVVLNHCVTEEHYYLRKNAMSTVGFYPRTSHIVSHHSTNRAKAISRDVMNRLCIRYNVGICKVAFPLHVLWMFLSAIHVGKGYSQILLGFV
jgi:hypothetical protein